MSDFSWQNIPNHFSFRDVYDLAGLRIKDGAVFVEVGSWLGASAAYFALKIKANRKRAKFFAIDNFTGDGSGADLFSGVGWKPEIKSKIAALKGNFLPLFKDNLRKCGVSRLVTVIKSDSTTAADRFANASVDFAFIDACHEYDKVKQDILAWLPKIKPGGILAGHDYSTKHPDVVRAVHEIFHSTPIKVFTHSWWVDV